MRGPHWSDLESRMLAQAIKRGDSWPVIAKDLKRTQKAVQRRAHRMGIAPLSERHVKSAISRRESENEAAIAAEFRKRDRAFVFRVVREAVSLGLVRV